MGHPVPTKTFSTAVPTGGYAICTLHPPALVPLQPSCADLLYPHPCINELSMLTALS